jgi:hypothetical protein
MLDQAADAAETCIRDDRDAPRPGGGAPAPLARE